MVEIGRCQKALAIDRPWHEMHERTSLLELIGVLQQTKCHKGHLMVGELLVNRDDENDNPLCHLPLLLGRGQYSSCSQHRCHRGSRRLIAT